MSRVNGPVGAVTVDLPTGGPCSPDRTPVSGSTIDGQVGTPVPRVRGAAVAVGFDAGGAGTSALLWAVEEADRTGRQLRLVSATDEPVSQPGHLSWRRQLSALLRHLAVTGIEYSLGSGAPAHVLLAATEHASLLVVGRRGAGHSGRRDLGGTAAALAGSSPIPVIVVPQQWSQSSTFNAPVLVSRSALHDVDGEGAVREDGALWFALERAARYHVPLVVISGTTAVPAPPGRGDQRADGGPADRADGPRYEAVRRTHPAVEIVGRSLAGPDDQALIEISGVAQLVVVARPTVGTGENLNLLRRSSAPVAIIPTAI